MADQSERPEPDHSEDPRSGEVSDRGYPESEHEGQADESSYPHEGPQQGEPSSDEDEHGEPGVAGDADGTPGQATGNPRAAGG